MSLLGFCTLVSLRLYPRLTVTLAAGPHYWGPTDTANTLHCIISNANQHVCPQCSSACCVATASPILSPSPMACQHRKWARFPAAFQSTQICEGAHMLVFMPVKALGTGLAPPFTSLHGVACCTVKGWLKHGCCRCEVQALGVCWGSVGRRSQEAGSSLGEPRATVWTGTLDQRFTGAWVQGNRGRKFKFRSGVPVQAEILYTVRVGAGCIVCCVLLYRRTLAWKQWPLVLARWSTPSQNTALCSYTSNFLAAFPLSLWLNSLWGSSIEPMPEPLH